MPNKLIFILILLLGLVLTLAVPPFQKPDENRHYYQVEAISRGIFGCHTNQVGQVYLPLPASVVSFPTELKAGEIAHTYHRKFFRSQLGLYPYPPSDPPVEQTNWCSPAFFGYLPNLPGILVGQLVNSRLVGFYLARLFALAFFLSVFYISLRRTPAPSRAWLYLYGLTPMLLHQVGGINYDTLQLALVPLVFSYFLNPPSVLWPFWTALLFCVITKPSYAPLLLLAYLPKKSKLVPTTLFVLVASLLVVKLSPAPYFSEYPTTADASLQLGLIMRDPWYLVTTIFSTLTHKFQEIFTSFVGRFGWLDYQLPDYLYYLYFAIFAGLVWHRPRRLLPARTLIQLFFVLGLSIFGVMTALYLYWTPVGLKLIEGIQGRYFLPLLPFAGLFLQHLLAHLRSHRLARQLALTLLSLLLFYHLSRAVYHRYWDYAQSGINDLQPSALEHANYQAGHYLLAFPGKSVKLTGFYLRPPASIPPAKYELRSPDCSQLLYHGYLQNYRFAPQRELLTESFPPQWVDNPVCLTLTSLAGSDLSIDAIAPLYLVPSLRE